MTIPVKVKLSIYLSDCQMDRKINGWADGRLDSYINNLYNIDWWTDGLTDSLYQSIIVWLYI